MFEEIYLKNVNKYSDDWGVHYEIAYPGCKKEDIDVSFSKKDSILTIKPNLPKSDKKYELQTISYCSYQISVDESRFNTDKIEVKYENGILYIAIPFGITENGSVVKLNIC